jgi:hypothetical protein
MAWRTAIRRAACVRAERGWLFPLLVTLLFAGAEIYGHYFHEMWKDELHCWAVARNSSGLWDLLTGERRYDGHPFLWYYLLYLVTLVSRSYVALHVVGVSLAVTAALLWLRYAPLPRWLRVLGVGSYYMLYEYGVVTRSYMLGIVLVFAVCVVYHPLRIRYMLLATLLGLLAATSMYGTLMASALGVFVFTRGIRFAGPDREDDRARMILPAAYIGGLVLFAAGLALTAITTWPPSDAAFAPPGKFELSFAMVRSDFARYWAAMFPFRRWNDWNWLSTTYLGRGWGLGEGGAAALGGGWFVAWLFVLRRAPWLASAYALGVLMMMAAQHAIYPAGLRHLGHYFVLLLGCVWLYQRETRGRASATLLYIMLGVNLAPQLVTGLAALGVEQKRVFSGAVLAAKYIRDHHLEQLPIVGSSDHSASPVAIALDRPVWLLGTGETSDVVVEHNRLRSTDESRVLEVAGKLAAHAPSRSALLLLNHDLHVLPMRGVATKLLYRGPPAIMFDEVYRIYELRLEPPRKLPAAKVPG